MHTHLDADRSGGCWPNQRQMQLLHAALDDEDTAWHAWREWHSAGGMQLLPFDPSIVRLLPLVYLNLARYGAIDPSIAALEDTVQEARAHTLFVFSKCAGVLQKFAHSGLDPLVLKGAPLSIAYYRDIGARPMSDMDVCIAREHVPAALRILHDHGFRPRIPLPKLLTPAFFAVHHAWPFSATSQGAPCELDLHWRVLADYDDPQVDADLRHTARALPMLGVTVRSLDATGIFFHVCAHGVAWAPLPPLRWVADAVHILRSADAVDWERLEQLTTRAGAALAVADALAWLRRHFDAPIPDDVVERIARLPVSTARRRLHRANTERSHVFGRLPFHLARRAALFPGLPLIEYLRIHYGAASDREALRLLLHKALDRSTTMMHR